MWDLSIVGGGILGALIAREAALQGLAVMLMRRSDRPRPNAETLRNQAWLQSGLMYAMREAQRLLAGRCTPDEYARAIQFIRQIRDARTVLSRDFPEQTQGAGGVIAIAAGARVAFDKAVADLYLAAPRELDADEARLLCGTFWRTDVAYFEIPDRTFDESRLLEIAAREARAWGASLVEIDDVQLRSDGDLKVVADGQTIEARQCVIAAGCATPLVLQQLDIDANLEVVRTPLLVVKETAGLNTSVLVDREKRFSVTSPSARDGSRRLVFGAGMEERDVLESLDRPANRDVDQEKQRALLDAFHVASQENFKRSMPAHRFTAGFEIHKRGALAAEQLGQIIERSDKFPNLWWALPGRATQALATARALVAEMAPDVSRRAGAATHSLREWTMDDIAMYFDPSYDTEDDGRKTS